MVKKIFSRVTMHILKYWQTEFSKKDLLTGPEIINYLLVCLGKSKSFKKLVLLFAFEIYI